MQNLFIKIRCVSWKKLFFSCCLVGIYMTRAFQSQYALENKVCISTSGAWRWYTVPSVYRLLARALTYRADGIPTSGAVRKFAQSRYTGFWRPKGYNWWSRTFVIRLKLYYKLLLSMCTRLPKYMGVDVTILKLDTPTTIPTFNLENKSQGHGLFGLT